jgi:hypothetical protein
MVDNDEKKLSIAERVATAEHDNEALKQSYRRPHSALG